jgi:hypothetical protein
MSFWDKDNYKVRLVDFIERFVTHNTIVRLFKHTRIKDEQGMLVNRYDLLWTGMDWQITEGYADSSYFKMHKDVEPCPYGEFNVIAITSADISGDCTCEASLIIEVDE